MKTRKKEAKKIKIKDLPPGKKAKSVKGGILSFSWGVSNSAGKT